MVRVSNHKCYGTVNILLFSKYPPLQGGVSAAALFASVEAAKNGHTIFVVTNSNHATTTNRIAISCLDTEDMTGLNKNRELQGQLEVIQTSNLNKFSFIPWTRPDISQLIGAAIRISNKINFELIVGWYLEPFGVAAAYASSILKIPFSIICAGSDIGRLANNKDLGATYTAVVSSAQHVITAGNIDKNPLTKLGLKIDQCVQGTARPVLRPSQSAIKTPSNTFLSQLLSGFNYRIHYSMYQHPLRDLIVSMSPNDTLLSEDTPLILATGKVHPRKGYGHLIESLHILLAQNFNNFRLLLILSGNETRICSTLNDIHLPTGRKNYSSLYDVHSNGSKPGGLAARTVLLPIIHPALMPDLFAHCDIVCCLDNCFPIKPHQSRVIRETLAASSALVCSRESADKSGIQRHLISGQNCEIIEDPNDTDHLSLTIRNLLTNRNHRRRLQINGYNLSSILEKSISYENPLEQLVEAHQSLVSKAHQGY